jgi:hypothetical protein
MSPDIFPDAGLFIFISPFKIREAGFIKTESIFYFI